MIALKSTSASVRGGEGPASAGFQALLVGGCVRDILLANEIVTPTKIARLANLAISGDLTVCVDDADNVRIDADRKRVLFILNKAGNNLNQIAHVANSAQLAGKLSESTFVELLDELELIQQLLKAHLYRVD